MAGRARDQGGKFHPRISPIQRRRDARQTHRMCLAAPQRAFHHRFGDDLPTLFFDPSDPRETRPNLPLKQGEKRPLPARHFSPPHQPHRKASGCPPNAPQVSRGTSAHHPERLGPLWKTFIFFKTVLPHSRKKPPSRTFALPARGDARATKGENFTPASAPSKGVGMLAKRTACVSLHPSAPSTTVLATICRLYFSTPRTRARRARIYR
jgi:hypothetical protein